MYLAIDTETGGTRPQKHTLLTICVAVVGDDLEVIDSLHLALRDLHGVYRVTPKALEVNKIDLVTHDANALPVNEVDFRLDRWLRKHTTQPLVPLGWNVAFDMAFIRENLPMTAQHLSYRIFDVQSVNQAAWLCGTTINAGLHEVARHFGIDTGVAHTADADVQTTLLVLRALLASFDTTHGHAP